MTDYVTESNVGQEVKFSSKATNDLTEWDGIVVAVGNYQMAQLVTDIVSYNAAVQKADNTVGDYTTLSYFIIKLTSANSTTILQAFANEWITAGSFAAVQTANIIRLDIYSPTTADPTNVLALLRSNGYTVDVNEIITPSTSNATQ